MVMEQARKKLLYVWKLRSLALPKLQKNEIYEGLPVTPNGENGFPVVL